MDQRKPARPYETPAVRTMTSDEILDLLGPASGGSGNPCALDHPVFRPHPGCKD